jgi:intracellular septation protein A
MNKRQLAVNIGLSGVVLFFIVKHMKDRYVFCNLDKTDRVVFSVFTAVSLLLPFIISPAVKRD